MCGCFGDCDSTSTLRPMNERDSSSGFASGRSTYNGIVSFVCHSLNRCWQVRGFVPDNQHAYMISRPTKTANAGLDLVRRISFDFRVGAAIRLDSGAGSSNGTSPLPSKSQTCSRSSNVKWHSGQRFIARMANSIVWRGSGWKRCRLGLLPEGIREKENTHIRRNGQPSAPYKIKPTFCQVFTGQNGDGIRRTTERP